MNDTMFLPKLADSSALSNAMRNEEPLGSYAVFPLPNGNPNEYAIAAATESRFDIAVAVKETDHHLYLNPYDIMDTDSTPFDITQIFAGNGDELKKGDSVLGQSYKYVLSEDDKELINSIVDSSCFSLEEIFAFIVEFLEDLQFIPNVKKGYKEVKASDLMHIFRVLMPIKRFSTDQIIDTLCNASNDEKIRLLQSDKPDNIVKAFTAMLN